MMNIYKSRITMLALHLTCIPFLCGCGSTGDDLKLICQTSGEVRVGDVLEFEIERVVNDGTVFRTYQVDEYEIFYEPAGAINIDKMNKTLTIMKPGEVNIWVEANVAPVDLQERYVDWTSKRLESNAVSMFCN